MATQELNVKFKVETTDLRKGSSDAKSTVRGAAEEMARDVKGAAADMTASMGKVENATKSIGSAASVASSGVKSLERDVAQSANNMERNLGRIRKQMSAMQMFHLGARGVTMIGGAAANIARLNGNSAAASDIETVTSIATGAFQGAAIGTPFGPWGQVIGGLMGAGSALLEAAAKQKEAALAQINQARETIEGIDSGVRSRRRRQDAEEMANLPLGVFNERLAQDRIDQAKKTLKEAEERQNAIQDMLYGRNNTETTITNWGQLLYNDPTLKFKKLPDGSVLDFDKDLPQSLGVVNWVDNNSEKYIKNLISDAVNRRSVYPTFSNTIGSLGGGPKEYGDIEGDRSFYYAFNKLMRITSLGTAGFSRDDLLDKITSHVFQTLSEKAKAAAKEVEEASAALSDLAPLQQRLDREAAESEARKNSPLPIDDWGEDYTQEPRAWTDPVNKEALTLGRKRLSDFESALNGVLRGGLFPSPTDALTRIGGGRGYSSYNDSTARIQKSIEANLRTLIQNQTDQNNEILQAIQNLEWNGGAEWQD